MALSVTGLGMVSSVGRSALGTCAALRAGLSQPCAVDDFQVLDEEEQEPTPLMGHPIQGYTEGFVGLGRWLRLAEGCIADLVSDVTVPDAVDAHFWQRTGLVVVTPRLDDARYIEAEGDKTEVKEAFLQQLIEMTGLPISEGQAVLLDRGGAGAAAAVELAEQRGRVLLVGVDSLLDVLSLEWFHDRGRLKTRAHPVGLMPGEAGACVLLESSGSARGRRANTRAVIESAAIDLEANSYLSGKTNTGVALARVIRAAVTAALQRQPFSGDVVLDLNGEVWRAMEWGHAQPRLTDVLAPDVTPVLPASSLGDVGAAGSVLGVGIAAQALARGYATGPRTLIVSSSEYGDVGALVVGAER